MSLLGSIVTEVLLPILLMVAVGAVVRWRFHLDTATLSKLNLWIFSPAFIFDKVANSTLPWSSMGGVVLITVMQVVCLGVVVWVVGRVLGGASRATLTTVALAAMFYNSGNYGIPLAELAYPKQLAVKDGGATQAFVAMSQNFLVFTLGMWLATRHEEGATWRKSLGRVFSLPAVPVLVVALLARAYLQGGTAETPHHLPAPIAKTTAYLSAGLVPVSLVTLGSQLAAGWRRPRWRPLATVCVTRLVFAPLQMALMLKGFHLMGWRTLDLWPWPAEVLIVTSAVPSAVNILLLTIETGGDRELAADCVFWTTVISPVSIGITLAVVRILFA